MAPRFMALDVDGKLEAMLGKQLKYNATNGRSQASSHAPAVDLTANFDFPCTFGHCKGKICWFIYCEIVLNCIEFVEKSSD